MSEAIFRGAHPSRVLADGVMPLSDFVPELDRSPKLVLARRQNQHASRVRSPAFEGRLTWTTQGSRSLGAENFAEQPWAAINVSGVELQELRAGVEFLARRFRVANSADTDDRKLRVVAKKFHHFRGACT